MCQQYIEIDDGGTVTTIDCSSNNDFLPTLLYTSTSHFIRISIVDNMGSAGGYYFVSVEGKAMSIANHCGSHVVQILVVVANIEYTCVITIFLNSWKKYHAIMNKSMVTYFYGAVMWAFAVNGKVGIPETGLTTPIWWLSLLPLTVLSRSAIVVESKFLGRFCVVALLFTFFCGCRRFLHRTESDLVLFLLSLERILSLLPFLHPKYKKIPSFKLTSSYVNHSPYKNLNFTNKN